MSYIITALVCLLIGMLLEHIVGPITLLIGLFSKQGAKVSELGEKIDDAGDELAEKIKDIGEDISNLNKE